VTGLLLLGFPLCWEGLIGAQNSSRSVKKVSAIYPELAHRMKIQGTVKIEVTVAPNGTVKSTKVIGGHPLLVESCLDAVKKWRFAPAPEESTEVAVFNFVDE
jgi:protein TonB